MRIKKIGVVGAGTMGAGIAALAASAGIPVVLLDIPAEGDDRNAIVKKGLERALKARPAAFMDRDRARLIEIGNTEDDLGKLGDVDWVVEAIIEKPEPKQALFARLEGVLKPDAIVSTNTSGIPMKILTEGRSEAFKKRFLGTHFFNPPRYLHLLEIIPGEATDPEVTAAMEAFAERVLGKGVVRAKDVPGFVANRLGVYGMVQAVRLMEKHGLSIEAVDTLLGPLTGRPKSAIFRTADLTGLDVLLFVAGELAEATGEDFALPEWVKKLVEMGRLGEKTKAGFYKKEGKEILALDPATLEYRPREKPQIPGYSEIKDLPLEDRLPKVLELPAPYGPFLEEFFAITSHYTLAKAPEIAYDLVAVDRAMRWGFGFEMGPFEQMDAVGLERVKALFAEFGLSTPALLEKAEGRFYRREEGGKLYLTFEGGYAPVPSVPGQILLAELHEEGRVVKANKEAALLDLGDGVLLLEFRGKMNAIGEGVLSLTDWALKYIEKEGLNGLVVANDDPRTFSAGANLGLIAMLIQEGDWDELDQAVRTFQRATMGLRYAPFPVVVAPAGLALGGGAEYTLHADRVVAHAELYMGLVEVGVGLIPAGGGTKELLFRFSEELASYGEADPFAGVRRAFETIAMAKTSTSALEAKGLGYLRPADEIVMNRDRLIGRAKAAVLHLAENYVPPVRGFRRVRVLGKEAFGNLKYAIWQFREAGQITDHEVKIATELAYVLSGGDGPPREVSEDEILDLEREAFLKLAGTRKTLERVLAVLKTGKPIRN